MTLSSVRSFSDPEDYGSSIRAAHVRFTSVASGQFEANVIRIDLHKLWMQRLSSNLPHVAHVEIIPGRAIFMLCTDPDVSFFRGRVEIGTAQIERLADGQITFQRSPGSASFGAMSLPMEELEAIGAATNTSLRPPKQAVVISPSPAVIGRLQRLHAAAGYLALQAPEIIANPEAARGLEDEFIRTLASCIGSIDQTEDRAAKRSHDLIMRRFGDAVADCANRVIYLPELCSRIGVSERTLQSCCQEHLGVSPLRYLWLRRMQQARQALWHAHPHSLTVSEVATAYGFWELSRFAVGYRSRYGERPSETLARPPDHPLPDVIGDRPRFSEFA